MAPLEILFLTTVLVLTVGAAAYFLNSKFNKLLESQKNEEAQRMLWDLLKEMRGSVEKNTETLNQKLAEQNKALGERLDNAARVVLEVQKSMRGVQKEVGIMSEIGHSMKSLQDFLKSPKLRGNIGEQVLGDLLAQMLPREAYTLQYGFKDGQKCDAVLRVAEGLIPVDAKFPL